MRILIVEDDPISLRILRTILESEHCHEIVPTTNGTDAWRELTEGCKFDLCIFDVMMPGQDGLQLTARLRANPELKSQRVLFCTAMNDRNTVTQAMELGVVHYIVKPYEKKTVLSQISRIGQLFDATARQIDDAGVIAARLGVNAQMVDDLRQDLRNQVKDCLVALRAAPDHRAQILQDVDHALRINSLKGAALNLGFGGLANNLAILEQAYIMSDVDRTSPAQKVEEENNRR